MVEDKKKESAARSVADEERQKVKTILLTKDCRKKFTQAKKWTTSLLTIFQRARLDIPEGSVFNRDLQLKADTVSTFLCKNHSDKREFSTSTAYGV